MHQDAHEFLNYLLNRVMEDMEEDGRKLGSGANGTGKSGEDCEYAFLVMVFFLSPSSSVKLHRYALYAARGLYLDRTSHGVPLDYRPSTVRGCPHERDALSDLRDCVLARRVVHRPLDRH